MYLSQLKLDLRNRITQNWLKNPYHIHQRLWMAFSDDFQKGDSESAPFLYQFDTNQIPGSSISPRILVFSTQAPNWKKAFGNFSVLEEIPDNRSIKEISPSFIRTGISLRFSITANPTKKKKDYRSLFREELKNYPEICDHSNQNLYSEGKAKLEELIKTVSHEQREKLKSKKVGVYREQEQLQWIAKRGSENGFEILNVIIESSGNSNAFKTKATERHKISKIHTVTFSGVLRITNPEKFKTAYTKGIGSGKAFGCGMLLLARI
ncbi:CRISPR-associated protein Cas6/Cse3/CasE, subtype TIGR01907-like protein [Leptospira fainei serovar Hurstbridge str. BUT 6]|uniref:CRISPR-associated protein Cas6/Cse3/CasE, subtype TIGR01907-like protein n=1 Tax=Leptospira fainei serovar Hurstbridge str. BUT 6 TaxID=1193011 RepID=S3VF65_9LEPT|nr:type I-E CRISPR-associated protein Cas6/Cse3/CasE [Leptospira fainei]EPG75125.1 CRISPR-associated protein Cas6/Cse3/CasE, subtype TIGR01907-like protein [Leptospira fainei serovar Hurstbridge str. BUT 6]